MCFAKPSQTMYMCNISNNGPTAVRTRVRIPAVYFWPLLLRVRARDNIQQIELLEVARIVDPLEHD